MSNQWPVVSAGLSGCHTHTLSIRVKRKEKKNESNHTEKRNAKKSKWNKTRGNLMKAKWKISFPYLFLVWLRGNRKWNNTKKKNCVCVLRVCLPPSLFQCCVNNCASVSYPISTRRSRSRLPATPPLAAVLFFSFFFFFPELEISDTRRRKERKRLTGINLAEATAKLFDLFEFLRRRGDTRTRHSLALSCWPRHFYIPFL